jgi:ApeA N-terminal domain 1
VIQSVRIQRVGQPAHRSEILGRMSQTLKERGFFWWLNEPTLPAHSQQTAVPAQLTISSDGQIALEVEGSLCRNDEYRDWFEPRILPSSRRLVGELLESHEYVLLEGLERTDLGLLAELPQRQSFSIEQCTRRDSLFPDDYTQEGFLELLIDMDGFEDWLDLDSILVSTEYEGKGDVQVQVSYKAHEFVSPCLDGTISIKSMTTGADFLGYFATHPQRDVHFKQTYDIAFRPGKLSDLYTLRYVYTKLEEFIALLTGFYRRLNWPILVRNETPFETWNTFYFGRGTSPGESINNISFGFPSPVFVINSENYFKSGKGRVRLSEQVITYMYRR